MEKKSIGAINGGGVHCLVLSFPGQGHINPMLQFAKRLQHEGVRVTLVTTRNNLNKIASASSNNDKNNGIALEAISDGFDSANGKFGDADKFGVYRDRFWQVGPKTLSDLIQKLSRSGHPVDCLVYDSFLTWALDVAHTFGIVAAAFLTQNLAINSIYYHVHLGKLSAPLSPSLPDISLPKLPKLQHRDMPYFFLNYEQDPAFLKFLAAQFSNIHKADWILSNTFYELEKEVADWTTKIWPKFRTIGPCIPSMFLDKQIKDDQDYGLAEFKSSEECMEWLDDKPKGSVVYVSFGSMAELIEEQIEEIAWGLRESGSYFLWVVRESEESKLPKQFEKKSKKGLIVTWCPQLRVLAHEAVGCFVTHCGWNSTLEALSLGVPVIAMPQWSDQNTNAKYISDVWKMGIRPPIIDDDDERNNIVRGEALKCCIREIMEEGQWGEEVKINAMQWKTLATEAVGKGGSSHNNIMQVLKSFQFHNQAT